MQTFFEFQEGDCRVARGDYKNFVVQRYTKVEPKVKKGEPAKDVRYEWQVIGYFGNNLKLAAEQALKWGTCGEGRELLESLARSERAVMASVDQAIAREAQL